jgi:hypothetical protein
MTKDCAERILDDWQSERDTEELVAMNGHGVRSGRAGRSACSRPFSLLRLLRRVFRLHVGILGSPLESAA